MSVLIYRVGRSRERPHGSTFIGSTHCRPAAAGVQQSTFRADANTGKPRSSGL